MQQFKRFEFKYLIRPYVADAIYNYLLRYMTPDLHSLRFPRHIYPVTSLYFDTPTKEDYLDKAGGFLTRKKIRVRVYSPTLTKNINEIWLEKKEKYNMQISKKRINLNYNAYVMLLSDSKLSLLHYLRNQGEKDADPVFYSLFHERMRPHIIVRYNRAPLVSTPQSDVRITFDSNIEACRSVDLRYTQDMISIVPHMCVMEVKFSTILPFWFKQIIQDFHLNRITFSKYGKSVEAIYRYHPIPR